MSFHQAPTPKRRRKAPPQLVGDDGDAVRESILRGDAVATRRLATADAEEDCVEYSLFRNPLSPHPSASLPLPELAALVASFVAPWTADYIWHKDCFSLHISDNDGEFLLIEAASQLPAWVDPSTAANRIMAAIASAPEEDSVYVDAAPGDSDSWMEISPEELERELEEKTKATPLGMEDLEGVDSDDADEDEQENQDNEIKNTKIKAGAKKLARVVKGFQSFVDTESSVDGVRFPGEQEMDIASDDDAFGEDSDSDEDFDQVREFPTIGQTAPPIEFDPEKFMASMMKLLAIDESILKEHTIIQPDVKKPPNARPLPLPDDFDPTALLRPKHDAITVLPLADDDGGGEGNASVRRGQDLVADEERSTTRRLPGGLLARKSRHGLQQTEEDSDEERDQTATWDATLVRGVAEGGAARRPAPVQAFAGEPDSDDEDGGDGSDAEIEDEVAEAGLEAYMEAMDRELASTKVGRPLERGSAAGDGATRSDAKPRPVWKPKDGRRVLADLGLGDEDDGPPGGDDADDVADEVAKALEGAADSGGGAAVSEDVNLVRNLLRSFAAQQGLPGPASNILGRLGIVLPREEEETGGGEEG
ncbi:hypothetical protein HK405_004986 [Cladochytrium tenue]|nr:hypothetical protein HK405_004986 [Cladochytrium tenue]